MAKNKSNRSVGGAKNTNQGKGFVPRIIKRFFVSMPEHRSLASGTLINDESFEVEMEPVQNSDFLAVGPLKVPISEACQIASL